MAEKYPSDSEQQNDNPDLDELFESMCLEDTKENDNRDGNSTSDIPLITINNEPRRENVRKPDEMMRILSLQILDVHLSKLLYENPAMYRFANENYRNVKIVGTVINKQNTKENRAKIIVDDASARITCLIANSPKKLEVRNRIDEFIKDCTEHISTSMSEEDLIKKAQIPYGELMSSFSGSQETNDFLISCTKYLAESLKKRADTELLPLIESVNVGDQVKIVGRISDYKNERYIFADIFKVITNQAEYLYAMQEIILEKESYLRSASDTKNE